jgi:N-acetylmuramoyl-L-alanine amidase
MRIRHVVQSGESVVQLAERYRTLPAKIWDDDANAELREKRRNRMNVLEPGDALVIPDRGDKTDQEPTAQTHVYRRLGIPARYRLQVFRCEVPAARETFRIEFRTGRGSGTPVAGDARPAVGETDPEGVLDVPVPSGTTEADLYLGEPPEHFVVRFSQLRPVDVPHGQRQRLDLLGFEGGDDLAAALARFQHRFALEVTGNADEATMAKLDDFYFTVSDYPPPPKP